MDGLTARLDEIARALVLLVASDFDGTLAPIVSAPSAAQANCDSLSALKVLSQTPQTHVAIISGRALADLAARAREAGAVHLVGSHGSESAAEPATPLTTEARRLLDHLRAALRRIVASAPGCLLEEKPTGLACHYRNADARTARVVLDTIMYGPAACPGVRVRAGKKVVELSVVPADKGVALRRLRQQLRASAVLFMGDDATDEDAFATLVGPDVGVKVGLGATTAPYRVHGPAEVAQLLTHISERRAQWAAEAHFVRADGCRPLSD